MQLKNNSFYDVYPKTSWKNFKEIITEFGFECGFCEKKEFRFLGQIVEEEICLLFNSGTGLIIFAESDRNMQRIHQIVIYGEIIKNQFFFSEKQNQLISKFTILNEEKERITFKTRKIDGLISFVEEISSAFKLSKKWSSPVNINLIFSDEVLKEDFNKEDVLAERIQISDKQVQLIMGVC